MQDLRDSPLYILKVDKKIFAMLFEAGYVIVSKL